MLAEIFTDGSCLGNPGPGGWAVLLRMGSKDLEIQGGETYTTNNRMELIAAIQGYTALLHELKLQDLALSEVHLCSDSSWVLNTITKGWKRKKNLDLWAQLDPLLAEFKKRGIRLSFSWVKGHSGHPENENCDQRAQAEAAFWAKQSHSLSKTHTVSGGAPTLF